MFVGPSSTAPADFTKDSPPPIDLVLAEAEAEAEFAVDAFDAYSDNSDNDNLSDRLLLRCSNKDRRASALVRPFFVSPNDSKYDAILGQPWLTTGLTAKPCEPTSIIVEVVPTIGSSLEVLCGSTKQMIVHEELICLEQFMLRKSGIKYVH
ncbi:hypothetical protein BD410DRAFT_806472 [Rickenella mellea]|uniref:Uncharacterized protein n=1 Tax=Rickenella mellea TaxID=50990 RepID=A0A4Y7PT75_9AGAM|nr:hypothetical protein BD410DRAFT_806472 [Rickenella mellea]